MILRLFLTESAAWWGLALHAEVYDIHSEPNETREAFCITRRSHHFGPGKSNIYSEISLMIMLVCLFLLSFSLFLCSPSISDKLTGVVISESRFLNISLSAPTVLPSIFSCNVES